ncbi:MAG: glycerophosphodiester phosphodiesterase family protein [Candidatus Bathyarchaeota archaeon]
MGKTLIIAHRGASAYEPENSLKAVETAIKLKADMVEVDVRKSKDGELIVIHDEFVDRVSDGKGFVKNLTLNRLKRLNLALGEKIPTLKEVLNAVKGRVKLVIEVKSEGLERKIVKLLEKERIVEDVIMVSFNHQIIRSVKTLNKKITCGIIFKCKPLNPSQQALNAKAEAVFQHYSYASKDFVENLHKDGLKVYAWTVNNVDDGKILIKNGVDGIVTDKPDIFTGVKFNLKRVFVAGPIQGMEKKQAYRVKLKRILKNLGFEVLDAWEREKVFYRFNSKRNTFPEGFIKRDLLDIGVSSLFVAYLPTLSAGTCMELFYARNLGKPTLTVCKLKNPSPWIVFHSTKIFSNLSGLQIFLEKKFT